jgi:hypothetical protein
LDEVTGRGLAKHNPTPRVCVLSQVLLEVRFGKTSGKTRHSRNPKKVKTKSNVSISMHET